MLKWIKRLRCKHELLLLQSKSYYDEAIVKAYICHKCEKEIIKVERR